MVFNRRAKREAAERWERSQRESEQRSQRRLRALADDWVEAMGPQSEKLRRVFGGDDPRTEFAIEPAGRCPPLSHDWAALVVSGFIGARRPGDSPYPRPKMVSEPDRTAYACGFLAWHMYVELFARLDIRWTSNDVRPSLDRLAAAWGLPAGELERSLAIAFATMAIINGDLALFDRPNLIGVGLPGSMGNEFRFVRGWVETDARAIAQIALDLAQRLKG